jgi:hypothetical protein
MRPIIVTKREIVLVSVTCSAAAWRGRPRAAHRRENAVAQPSACTTPACCPLLSHQLRHQSSFCSHRMGKKGSCILLHASPADVCFVCVVKNSAFNEFAAVAPMPSIASPRSSAKLIQTFIPEKRIEESRRCCVLTAHVFGC